MPHFKFKNQAGEDFAVIFKHHGKSKKYGKAAEKEAGTPMKCNKPPKSTECIIVDSSDVTVASATAKAISDFPMLAKNADELKELQKRLKRRVRHIYKMSDKKGFVVIVGADNFSYDKARKVSLEKALKNFTDDRVTRRNAWIALEAATMAARMKSAAALTK